MVFVKMLQMSRRKYPISELVFYILGIKSKLSDHNSEK